jgi:hypothetical protein
MKGFIAVAACAVTLGGCGIASKMDSLSILDSSRAAYRTCITEHRNDPAACNEARLAYQADLDEAERPRGIFTNWSAL